MSLLLSVFKWVLYSSAMASVLAVIIILFKLLLKNRLGVRWHYCVWFLVLVRLIIPFAPQSPFSVFNIFNIFGNTYDYSINNTDTGLNDTQSLLKIKGNNLIIQNNNLKDNKSSNNTINKDYFLYYYIKTASLIWLFGVIILGIYTLVVTLQFGRKVRTQKFCMDEGILNLVSYCKNKVGLKMNVTVLYTDLVKTPAVFGLIKPKMLLPTSIENKLTLDELQYIIFHELAHLKRKDIVFNCIGSILGVVHWFNPILWYSFRRMRQDGELACDSLAMSYIDPTECKKYGQTIIRLLEGFSKRTHVYGMAGIIEDKSQIRRRITMISLFKKSSYKWSVVSVLVLLILSGIMLTNAKGAANDEKLEAVWQDIKQTYKIDEQEYYRVRTDGQLKQFLNGKLNGFTDKNFIKQYDIILNVDHRFKLPVGATKPILLLKNDHSEIVFAYKEKDGSNILHKFKKNGDAWDSISLSNDFSTKSDSEKKALKEMYDFELAWDKTAANAFAIDLNGYRKIDTMVDFMKPEYNELQLVDVRKQIPLKYGDIRPSIYLNKSNTQGIAVTQDLNGLYTLYEFEVNNDKASRFKWKITGTKTVQGERKFINETVKDFFTKNPTPSPDDEKRPPLQTPTSEYETIVQQSPYPKEVNEPVKFDKQEDK